MVAGGIGSKQGGSYAQRQTGAKVQRKQGTQLGSQLFVSRNISFSDKFRLFREIYPKFRLCFVHISFHVSKHGQLVAIIAEAAILKRYNHILS